MAGAQMPRDERLAPLIDAALHRYFSQLTRRYVPILAGLAVLALVAVVLPSRQREATSNLATRSGPNATTGTGPAAGAAGGDGDGAAGEASVGPGGSTGGGSAGGPTDGPAGVVQGSLSGTAKSGVECGAGVLQVTWTPYAPPCVAAFTGNNGGATAPGVTDTTITITLRNTPDTEPYTGDNFELTVADLQVFIDFFNKNYEFYGRQLVLKTYRGQGAVALEIQGQGQAGAQADAQTEQDMGAFANVGDGFLVFGAALAEHGVMLPGIGFGAEWVFRQYSPYLYHSAAELSADDFGHAAAAAVCQRMKGMPAIFAGDPVYQKTNRVFGLLAIQQPDMKPAGDVFEQDARNNCGLTVKRADYSFNVATEPQQAVSIVAQMKAAGVTTLVSAADPLMFAQMTLAAQQSDWHPEYLTLDPLGIERNGDPNQTSHAMKVAVSGRLLAGGPNAEPGRVFALASGGAEPQQPSPQFVNIYTNLLQLVNAVQAAGPNLTPDTYLAAKSALPDAFGDFGLWKRSQLYSETADFVVSRFDPKATSPEDGEAGSWNLCDGGARYLSREANMGSGQLGC